MGSAHQIGKCGTGLASVPLLENQSVINARNILAAMVNRKVLEKPARSDKDLHQPLDLHDDLDSSFAWREERTVIHAAN